MSLYPVADELEAAAHAGDWARYGESDIRFHSGLARTSGSARLVNFFDTTLRLLKLAMLIADEEASIPSQLPAQVNEHRRLLQLIAARAPSEPN